ncbi:MAG: hypothetical protein QW327_05865 [Candidatus Odinarchaeota archaeon]
MRTAERVKKEIAKKYNKDPEGWKAWATKDSQHNLQWVFQHDQNLWMIKEYMINPYKTIGVGGRTKDSSVLEHPNYLSFGLRPIPERTALEILEIQDPVAKALKTAKIMMSIPPLSLERLDEDYIIHGPVILTPRKLEDLSYKQRILQQKLDDELARLKYKSLAHLYGMFT